MKPRACLQCGLVQDWSPEKECADCERSLSDAVTEKELERRFAELIGKTMIVGYTYKDAAGHVLDRTQIVGKVIRADSKKGIAVEEDTGEVSDLPPCLTTVETAEPGRYELKATGKVVMNPGYLSTWTVTRAH